MITDEQRERLEHSASSWIKVILPVGKRLSSMSDSIMDLAAGRRGVDEMMKDAHLLAIAIRQLEQHLQQMKPYPSEELCLVAEAYIREYNQEDIKNLRDLLEHHAEYLAEATTCKKPELVEKPSQFDVTFGSASTGRIWIYLFGREYRVDTIIKAASALFISIRNLKDERESTRAKP